MLVDTNMLLSVYELRIDIIDEIEKKLGKTDVLVLEQSMKEIRKIEKQGKKKEKAARIALEYLEKRRIKKVKGQGKADDLLAEKARQGYWVATNDKALRKRIKEAGGRTLYLRSKKFFE